MYGFHLHKQMYGVRVWICRTICLFFFYWATLLPSPIQPAGRKLLSLKTYRRNWPLCYGGGQQFASDFVDFRTRSSTNLINKAWFLMLHIRCIEYSDFEILRYFLKSIILHHFL